MRRSRLVTASVVTSLVVAGFTVASGAGVVTRAAAAVAQDIPTAASTVTPAAEDYTRPDLTSARLAARLTAQRIEVTGLRTESTTTFANPDGSLTQESSATPIREQVDAKWQDVDTTLGPLPGGGFGPRVASTQIMFSSGGAGALARVELSGKSIVTGWAGSLPVPVVSGNAATYHDVAPGVDLVLVAGVSSYELSVVLTRRPAQSTPSFRFPLSLSGLTAAQTADGRVQLSDAAHKVVVTSNTASMWDAHRDSLTGQPSRISALATSLAGVAGGAALTITPAASFLSDPTVTYPVTLDPNLTWSEHSFAFISSGVNANNSYYDNTISSHGAFGITEVGTSSTNGTANRAMYNFNIGLPPTGQVTAATLNVQQTYAASCSGAAVNVWGVANYTGSPTPPTWNAAPQRGPAIVVSVGSNPECPSSGFIHADITSLAKTWAGQTNGSVELITAEGPTANYREFNGNYATVDVTYTTTPDAPSSLLMEPCDSWCPPGMVMTNSLSPTAFATGTDPGNASLIMSYELWAGTSSNPTTELLSTNPPGWIPSGTVSSVVFSTGLLVNGGQYEWRVRGYNGTKYGPYSSWVPFTIDTTPPAAATISSSFSGYTTVTSGNFSWNSTASDAAYYVYALDYGPTTPVGAVGSPSISVSSLGYGSHTFWVGTVDYAGNQTDSYYSFTTGPGVLTSPANQARTQRFVNLTGYGPNGDGWVQYFYRQGSTGSFQPVPINAGLTVTSSAAPLPNGTAWPVSLSSYPSLTWNVQSAVVAGQDGLVQVYACFYADQAGSGQSCSSPVANVQLTTHAFAESNATQQVGPGTVALLTGDYAVSATDVAVPSYKGSLSLGRTFTTLAPGTATTGAAGVFGPGWRAAVYGPNAGHADATFQDNSTLGYVTLVDADGTEEVYNFDGTKYSGVADTATGGSSIVKDSATQFTLTEHDGTQTVYANTGGIWGTTQVVEASNTPASTTTSFSLDSSGRVTQVLAPVPAGVSCAASPTTTPGCRTLQLTYAAATTGTGSTFSDYTGRLSGVTFTSWDPVAAAMNSLQVAKYAYDTTGHLRQAWDPRISPTLVTSYSYDANGRLATVAPPGLATTTFGYDSQGRITTVAHPDPSGPTATNTIAYGVPSDSSGPIDLTTAVTGAWGEGGTTPSTATPTVPVTAAAVFGPDHVPAATPTSTDWPYADLTYLDVNGREVNTASYGNNAWQIGATQYDLYGHPVWSISPGNRAQAITPITGVTDPAVAAMTTTLARANALATLSSYDATYPSELMSTLGPTHPIAVSNNPPIDGRAHVVNSYDQGATGGPYQLLTTSIRSAQQAGTLTDYDSVTTQTGYAPLVTGDPTGWALRRPTSSTTVMATGPNLTAFTRYNGVGQLIESRTPMGGVDASGVGNDAYTTVTAYYTATGTGGCASGALAGMVCSVGPAAQPSSGKPLPVTTSTYNIYDQPLVVSETAGTVVRTTTTGYDAAGRKTSSQVTVTPAGADGTAVPTQTFGYDPATGLPTTITTPTVVSGPSAPTGVTGSAGNGRVVVSWTAPAANGAPITGYTITTTPGGATVATTGATSAVVSGLTNGTAYTFTVHATNSAGNSAESSPSGTVTPVAPTGGGSASFVRVDGTAVRTNLGTAPLTMPAGVTNGDFLLSLLGSSKGSQETFTQPTGWPATADTRVNSGSSSNHVAAFLNHRIAANDSGVAYQWSESPWANIDLAVVEYAGISTTTPFDVASTSATQTASAPSLTTVSAGTELVYVLITPDTTTVTAAPAGFTQRVGLVTTGTTGGVNVRLYVFDKTQAAAGPTGTVIPTISGTASNAVVMLAALRPASVAPTVPGTPTAVTAAPGNGRAVVSWAAPASNGSEITGYTVTASPAVPPPPPPARPAQSSPD